MPPYGSARCNNPTPTATLLLSCQQHGSTSDCGIADEYVSSSGLAFTDWMALDWT